MCAFGQCLEPIECFLRLARRSKPNCPELSADQLASGPEFGDTDFVDEGNAETPDIEPAELAPEIPKPDRDEPGGAPPKCIHRAALERARWWLKYEDDRRTGYHARAGWLLGFAGVIAALAGSQAHQVLDRAEVLGATDRPLAAALLAVSAVAVGIAGLLAVVVLWPIDSQDVNPDYLSEWQAAESLEDMVTPEIGLLHEIVAQDAPQNDARMSRLNQGFIALLVALVFLVAHVLVFLQRSVQNPCSVSPPSETALSATLPTDSFARSYVTSGPPGFVLDASHVIAWQLTPVQSALLRLQQHDASLRSENALLRRDDKHLEAAQNLLREQLSRIAATPGRKCKK
jgi:hypothetical protein